MGVKAKYKEGDEVWFMWGKQPYSSVIYKVATHSNHVTYGVFYGLIHGSVSEEEVYSTKTDLLNHESMDSTR